MAYEAFGEEGPRPRNDAYTGLLAISFFAMLIASLLLLVDWYGYEGMENPAKKVKASLPPVKPVAGLPAGAPDVVKPGKGGDKAPPPMPPEKDKGEKAPPMPDKGKEKMDAKDGKEKMDAKDGKDKMEKKDDKKDDKKDEKKDDK